MDPHEGSRRSSPVTDQPLLPYASPRLPGGEGQSPASPTTNHGSRRVSQLGRPQQEVDIAEPSAQLDEKLYSRPSKERADSTSVDEARALNWIVPVQNGPPGGRPTVRERLEPTLVTAEIEQAKYAKRARLAGMAVNGAMFAQIVVNALVTGLSASTGNRNAQIGVSALGAIGTILASFLVRVRGTREPERSVTHSQNLEKFIRELRAFILDDGWSRDPRLDRKVIDFRVDFDKLQTAVHQSENGQPMA